MHLSISFLSIYYLYLFISCHVAFKDTVSYFPCTYCPVHVPAVQGEKCTLKANSWRDNKRLHVCIWGAMKRSSPTLHPPLLHQTPRSPSAPIPTLPITCKPRQSPASTLQNACLSTFTPPSAKKWLQQQYCWSASPSLSLSYLCLLACTHKHANSLICFLKKNVFSFHLLKWSEVKWASVLYC